MEEIGLDEIEVTQASSDGGLDLKCLKRGIDELTDLDAIKYYVQAKRYHPNRNVPIESVRALRGIMPDGYKGIFITTGKFSKSAYAFGATSHNRALILIDGRTLVLSCINKGLGFKQKPVFVREELHKILSEEHASEPNHKINKNYPAHDTNVVKKKITENDIRARILRIPKSILAQIPESNGSYDIEFEGSTRAKLKIDKTRTYFAGVTSFYRQFKLLDEDGSKQPKDAYWYFNQPNNLIEIYFER